MNKIYNKTNPRLKKYKTLDCAMEWKLDTLTKDNKTNLTIEGWANTSDKDRVGDIVFPSAFEKYLDDYKSNPIILYMHDWDLVIGKCIELKIIDNGDETGGLWVKVEISNASDVDHIKQKIKEGSLKTFSIGYNEIESDYDEDSKTNYVKCVELLEISVVTIPANSKAEFGITSEKEASKSVEISDEFVSYLTAALNEVDLKDGVEAEFIKELINIYKMNGEKNE